MTTVDQGHALRVAVVGTGFGAEVHVPALRAAGFDVRALVGRNSERTSAASARLGIGHACTSLGEALQLGLDAVSIASPPCVHAPQALEALDAGCHVLCEKPFTMSEAEARCVAQRARERQLVGLVGHQFRWAPSRAQGAQILRQGRLGALRMATFVDHMSILPSATLPTWFYEQASGGGWLGSYGSHLLDWVRLWFGQITAVSGRLHRIGDTESVDHGFSIALELAGGGCVMVTSSAAAYGPRESIVHVIGTSGSLWFEDDDVWIADAANPAGTRSEPAHLALEPVEGTSSPDSAYQLAHYRHLADAFRNTIRGIPVVGMQPASFADGVEIMCLLDAIRRSSSNDGMREVLLP